MGYTQSPQGQPGTIATGLDIEPPASSRARKLWQVELRETEAVFQGSRSPSEELLASNMH